MTTAYEYATEAVKEVLTDLVENVEDLCIGKICSEEKEQYLRGYIRGIRDAGKRIREEIKYIEENGL